MRRLALAFPYGVTYGNVAEAVAGPVMREIVFFTVYTYFFFVLAIYVLTAAETLQIAIYEYNVCLYYYTVATVAVLLPLAQLRSMHAIAYAGVLSSLAVFLAVGLCLADSLRGFEGVAPSVLKLGNSSFFNTFSAITCKWRVARAGTCAAGADQPSAKPSASLTADKASVSGRAAAPGGAED